MGTPESLATRWTLRLRGFRAWGRPFSTVSGALEQSSCGALSCWARVVPDDNRRNTREGGNTASVPPLKSNEKRGESYFVLRLVCGPVFWRLFPGVLVLWALLASGLLFRFCLWVWSRRVVLALLRRLFSSPGSVSKKRRRPRAPTQRPGFPTDRPRAERALGGGRE